MHQHISERYLKTDVILYHRRADAFLNRKTDREEIERFNHEIYKTVFESSVDAISVIDFSTLKFIWCNESAVRLHDTGSRENFIGLRPDHFSPEFQPNGEKSEELAAKHIETAFKQGKCEFEWTHLKRDGTPFKVFVTLSPMLFSGEKFIVAIGKDISDRKPAETVQQRLIVERNETVTKKKTLSGVIPICTCCKKIRDDNGYWNNFEMYIERYSDASFSHSICPECSDELYGNEDWYNEMKKDKQNK